MAAAIVILLIAWYFCKLRRAGDVHFSVLFQISFSESKRRKCLNLFNMSAGGGGGGRETLSLESKSRDIFIRIIRVRPKNAKL